MRVGDTGDTQGAYRPRQAAARLSADGADSDTLDLGRLHKSHRGHPLEGPLSHLRAMRLAQPGDAPRLARATFSDDGRDSRFASVTDGDGTVFDSAPVHAQAWCVFFEQCFNIKVEADEPNHFHGSDEEIVIREIRKRENRDLTTEELKLYEKKDEIFRDLVRKNGIKPVRGAPEFFAHVRTHGPVALVTNSPGESVDAMKYWTGTRDAFSYTVTGDDVKQKKPAPEGYLKAAELLGVPPDELVGFEDTPGGEEAALRAGIREMYIVGNTVARDDFPAADHHRIFGVDYHELSKALRIPEALLRQHRIPRL